VDLAQCRHTAHAGVCDLADAASIRRYISDAAAALGGIDVLVNNASAFGTVDTADVWATRVAIDLMAVVHASHAALPFLQQS
jgi:3-oxoacyl-[acyl-carrier protein] reductase